MSGLLTALLLGGALTLPAGMLAWLAGLILQARAGQSSPALWRSARLVAILPLLLAPVLFAIPQTLPPLPALEFMDELALDRSAPAPVRDVPAVTPAAVTLPSLQTLLAAVYTIGLMASLLFALRRHYHRRHLLAHSRVADASERSLLDREAGKLGLSAPEMRLCPNAVSPFLTGWRGVIVAPERLMQSPERARHALVHELCHLRRGDERDRLLGSALTILLWFNWPLRQIECELDAAREIACDSDAVEALGRTQCKAYAATLIESMRSSAQPVSAFGPHNRRQREMRIKAILSGGQTARQSLLTAGALLFLAIPVACTQTAVTPRRVVSAPVEQIAPPVETRVMNDAAGEEITSGLELQEAEDWDASIETLDRALMDPANNAYERAVALQLRGRANYELDRIDDAIADWQAAIDTGAMLSSEVYNYRVNIAQLLIVLERFDEALAAFDIVLAGDSPATPQLTRMLAQAYGQAGRFEEGLPYAEATYQATPEDRSNQSLMLFYFQQMGMDAEASALEALIAAPVAPAATPRQKVSTSPAPVAAAAPAATPQPVAAPDLSGSIVTGRITSAYGPRPARPAGSSVFHGGTDIAASTGTAISAPGAGTVVHAEMGYNGSERWGNTVEIDHGDGWSTVYAHLDAIGVASGQSVAPGQQIGTVGTTGASTGPHVHVELHFNGERVDPAGYLAGLD
ncbi:peptidoglycan DD-metalloendopeptidase family protein [Maricaulis salignorans]|uniref:peptidoglycan DD-metalloendopeptidase family protein n=1 Tax=Maricaulis salignorans TaxID=144026 RepID=UPI003A93C3B6